MQRLKALLMVLAVLCSPVVSGQDSDLEILTSPPGLVAGELLVDVDLGASGGAAELFLDGEKKCDLTAGDSQCAIDLGGRLHVHLLELVRPRGDGTFDRAERWLNGPGREAEMEIRLASRPIGTMCGGRLQPSAADGVDPLTLEVDVAGERIGVTNDDRTFGYPCAAPGRNRVVAASAIYPDGRRSGAVVVTDESGRPAASAAPTAVALEASSRALDPCRAVEAKVGTHLRPAEREGFEIVFVLAPGANYRSLAGLGRGAQGAPAVAPEWRIDWENATAAFVDADHLWHVATDSSLTRVDGFSEGRGNWLGGLFRRGTAEWSGEMHLADAVATSGLLAGATPRKRVVVLILGGETEHDRSRYSPEEAQSYLAEVGVPLVVLRIGNLETDGWPGGERVSTMADLAAAFETVGERLENQCVEWFPDFMHPQQIAASLPAGVMVAGASEAFAGFDEAVWRRVALADDIREDQPIPSEPIVRERVEVTAVDVLVRAKDSQGRPVTDLVVEDVRVAEDGGFVPILGLELLPQLHAAPGEQPTPVAPEPIKTTAPVGKIVPVAVYVERQLAGSTDIAPALAALSERADWLTALGPVDIVVADTEVELVLDSSNDPQTVRETLGELGNMPMRGHAIERIRTAYLREIREYPDRTSGEFDPTSVSSSTPDNALRVKTMTIARTAIFEEDALLRQTMARMNDWALALPAAGPRMLIVVGAGFDEDPVDFYMRFLELQDPSLAAAARAEFIRYHQATRVDAVGHELAAAGWLVVPMATRVAGRQRTAAEFSGGEKFQAFLTDNESSYIRDVDFMLVDPLGSQQHLAAPSGGEVVMGKGGLDRLIEKSTGWYQLSYQVARAPDGAFHELEVSSTRAGVELQSTGVVVSGTSEGRAAMRLRGLLDDPVSAGELSVKLALTEPQYRKDKKFHADLTASVDLTPIAPLFVDGGIRVLRFSVAVRTGKGVPFVDHHLVTASGVIGGMDYDAPLEWPKEQGTLAVVVEDLTSGAWGGTVQELNE